MTAFLLAPSGVSHGVTPSPVALNTNAATDSQDDRNPQVRTDGTGNWVAVWMSDENLGGTIGTDPDILVARSTDNGATWTAPAALNTNAATDSGWDWYPQVATDDAGNWVVIWRSYENVGGTIGTDADILVARSTDNGATWTAPAPLNTNAATDSGYDGWPEVTTDGAGNWVAVWMSDENLGGTIGTDRDILVARSTDNGATWTAPAPLNTNAPTDSGWDDMPEVTTDGGGNWVAVWYSTENLGGTIGTDSDILVARSTDNGATWTAPAALNTNAATDSGNDHAKPQVTTDGAGNWVAVWGSQDSLGGTIGTDMDILVSRSTDNGATWTYPAALNTNAATDSASEGWPAVTADGAGNWVAAWGSDDSLGGTIGTDWDILVASSTENGTTWTAPAALNTNAATDSGGDDTPRVATDGGGNWVTVWHSGENLGGTIGTDGDILYTNCSPLDADCDGVPESGAGSTPPDTDGDGVLDADDACPGTFGDPDRQGCPVGDANTVTLHVVDQQKSGACPGGKGSCKSPIEGAEVRVFDRNDGDFQTAYGTKNPSGSIYDQVFENDIGRVGACTTDAAGQCTAGEETTGGYLVIIKWADLDNPPKVVYSGKPKSPRDFVDTDADGMGDLASKDFQVIKVLKKNGDIQISGGSKTVVSGSYLEVVHPDFAIWEDAAEGYVYPFIFTSDSDWTVDVCAYVPTGYAIVGVYDENDNLISDASCTQTFVSGETKVVAYDVVDIGSPEPVLDAVLSVQHDGKVTEVDIEVPGVRTYVEEPAVQPAQLPDTGAGDSGDGTPVWPVVAALAGVAVILLGGTIVWRRRRA